MNPLCPPGYRHLLTIPEAISEKAVRHELCRMFGEWKGRTAHIVQGYYGPLGSIPLLYNMKWKVYRRGYTAFLLKRGSNAND